MPLGDNRSAPHGKLFKEMIQFCLIYPPFWFSMLKSKQAILILLEGNSRSLTLGSHIVSCEHPHMVLILDLSTSNMLEHTKLIDIISDPSNHLIDCILQPSVDVTSECTALLSQRSDYGGVSDSGFSLCFVPTYYCGSKYFLVSVHKFRT